MSEHCGGYIKGCWESLQNLCIHINNEKNLQYAVLWVIACIALHAFTIDHKDTKVSMDTFLIQGQKIMEDKAAACEELQEQEEERVAEQEATREES
jgi:hypothetical protein